MAATRLTNSSFMTITLPSSLGGAVLSGETSIVLAYDVATISSAMVLAGFYNYGLYPMPVQSTDVPIIVYVDSARGNDANDGTAAFPLQTFGSALSLFNNGWYQAAEIHLKGANTYNFTGDMYLGNPLSTNATPLKIIGDDLVPATGAGLATTTFAVTSSLNIQNLVANLNAAVGVNALQGATLTFTTGSNAGLSVNICTNAASTGGNHSTAIFFGVGRPDGYSMPGNLSNSIQPGDQFTMTFPTSALNMQVGIHNNLNVYFSNIIISGTLTADQGVYLNFTGCQMPGGDRAFSCFANTGARIDAFSNYMNGAFFLVIGTQPSRSSLIANVMINGTIYLGFIGWGILMLNNYCADSNFGGEELSPTTEIAHNTLSGVPPFGNIFSFGKGSTYINFAGNYFTNVSGGGAGINLYDNCWLTGGGNFGAISDGYYMEISDNSNGIGGNGGACRVTFSNDDAVTGNPGAFLIGDQIKGYSDFPFTSHASIGSGSLAATSANNLITGLSGLSNKNAGDIIIFTGFATSGNNGEFKILYVNNSTSATLAGPSGMIVSGNTNGSWKLYSIAQPINQVILFA